MLPECLKDLQPPEMIEWEREREKMEFERASKLYKPMSNILASRFTSAKSHDISHLRKCFLTKRELYIWCMKTFHHLTLTFCTL